MSSWAALSRRRGSRPVRVCVLEGIVDHTNVGAIFRSAAALNVDGILVSPTCCDPLYRRSARVSMGTVFQVPWTRIGSEARVWPHDGLSGVARCRFFVCRYGVDGRLCFAGRSCAAGRLIAWRSLWAPRVPAWAPRPLPAVTDAVRIPMAHGVDSLNVAAASAVAFWQLCPHVSNEYHYQPGLYH